MGDDALGFFGGVASSFQKLRRVGYHKRLDIKYQFYILYPCVAVVKGLEDKVGQAFRAASVLFAYNYQRVGVWKRSSIQEPPIPVNTMTIAILNGTQGIYHAKNK